LFPADCRLCNAPLINISRLPVCPDCLARITPLAGPTCSICGERVLAGRFSGGEDATATAGETPALLCGMCEKARPQYERALAYGPYDGALRDLIHLFKYDRVHPAAAVLGRMLAEVIAGLEIEADHVLVVPVPLYSAKQRQRGFNQAIEITHAALKLLRFPPFASQEAARQRMGHPQFVLAPERLVRVRDTQSQTGLTRHQRRENVRGAFVAVEPAQIAGQTVLLVDDVYTTGTTIAECSKVLRRAGAEEVYVATVARVLKSDAASAEPEVEEETTPKAMAAYA
jgi:ComF family protein